MTRQANSARLFFALVPEPELLRGLDALPHWIVHAVVVATRLLAIVVLVGGLAFTLWHGRLRLLVTASVAALVALGLAVLLSTFATGSGEAVVNVDNGLVGPLTAAGFPSASGVAVVTAILTAAAPWLSRRWRAGGAIPGPSRRSGCSRS